MKNKLLTLFSFIIIFLIPNIVSADSNSDITIKSNDNGDEEVTFFYKR